MAVSYPMGLPGPGGAVAPTTSVTPAVPQANVPSPAGTTQTPYNFVPVGGQQINTPLILPGTLNANISSPSGTQTSPAPAVITSQAAQDDLTNKQSQVSQINQDVNNQSQTKQNNAAAANQAAQTAQQNQANQKTDQGSTNTPSFDDQVNSLLSDLQSNTQQIQSQANQSESGILSQEDQNQIDQNNQYAATAQKLQDIASGTYPLSPSEQQLLSATANSYQQVIAAQQQANQAYTGQMAEAMASLGISTSAPTQAIGNIQATISSGNSKIAELDGQMAQSLATLQQGFQQNDFKMIQDSWTDAAAQFSSRQQTLQDMLSTVQTNAKQQQDDLQANTTMALTAIMDSNTISYQAKAQALQQAQLSETQRHDMESEMENRYQYNTDGTVFDKVTGDVALANPSGTGTISTIPGQTGIPIIDTNTRTTDSGISYIDGTNLTGTAATKVQNVAANLGIPYVGKDNADALANIETAKQNMSNILGTLQDVSPSNWATRMFVGPENVAAGVLQTSDSIASFNAYRSAAIQALRAMAGSKGLRINQAEILQSVNQDIPKITDTAGTAKAKIAKVQSMLDAQEKGIFGSAVYSQAATDSNNPMGISPYSQTTTDTQNNPVGI